MHIREMDQHPIEQRKRLAALLTVLENQRDDETRQMFLELVLSHLSSMNPALGRVALSLVEAAKGRDFDCEVTAPKVGPPPYRGGLLDGAKEHSVDLFILAIKNVERLAVLDAFKLGNAEGGFPLAHAEVLGREIWFGRHLGRTIGIGWVNGDGMVECAVAMAQYAAFVDFSNACLVGMAGGGPKVGLGQVVVASLVHDCDRRRVVPPRGRGGRKKNKEVYTPLSEAERRFVKASSGWKNRVEGLASQAAMATWWREAGKEMSDWTSPAIGMPAWDGRGSVPEEWVGKVWVKPILSGGALVEAEEELTRLLRQYDSEAVALDMESYGFAKWCESNQLSQWLVVRGVSDHCGPELSHSTEVEAPPRPKAWQYPATYFAARLLRDHLLTAVFFPQSRVAGP